MKKTVALITLAVVATLALCLVACGNSAVSNASSSNIKNDESIHYYQLEKLFKLSHADIHNVLNDDGLVYIENYQNVPRSWVSDKDVIANMFENVIVHFESDTKWAGKGFVPESEIDSEDYDLSTMIITLNTNKPFKSIFNSESSASKIANEIMDKCELSNQIRNSYEESKDGDRNYLLSGTCKMGNRDAVWNIFLVDGIDSSNMKIQKAEITITCNEALMKIYSGELHS